MAILDEMKRAAAEAEKTGLPHVWRIGDAIHAVQAGLKDEPSFPLVEGSLLLGYRWERAPFAMPGWELAIDD